MTIEITREDLLSLAEAAHTNTSSLMLMLKTTDGKRVTLLVAAVQKRTRNRRPVAQAASPSAE